MSPQLEEKLTENGYPAALPSYLDLIRELGIHRAKLRENYPTLAKGSFRRAADQLHHVKGKNVPSITEVISLTDAELQSRFRGVGPMTIEAWNILIKLYLNRNAPRR